MQVKTTTSEIKRGLTFSSKVAKLRKEITASYSLEQQGLSTSFHHLFIDKNKETAFEIKPKFGLKNTSRLYSGNNLIGSITIKYASRYHGIGATIVLGEATVGTVYHVVERHSDYVHFEGNLISGWEIEKGINDYIISHDGIPTCVFSAPVLRSKKVEVTSDSHLDIIMLICSAILLIHVEELRIEKHSYAFGGG